MCLTVIHPPLVWNSADSQCGPEVGWEAARCCGFHYLRPVDVSLGRCASLWWAASGEESTSTLAGIFWRGRSMESPEAQHCSRAEDDGIPAAEA